MDNLFTMIQQNIINPCIVAGDAFINNVAKPFWTSIVTWITSYTEMESATDFFTNLFKLKFRIRVYSFMIMIPIFFILMFTIRFIAKRNRKRRMKKLQKKSRRT